MTRSPRSLALAALALLAACGGKDPAAPSAPAATGPSAAAGGAAPAAPAPAASRFALPSEPAGAVSVEAALASASADSVVVVGRIRRLSGGFAAFTLVDASLDYCGGGECQMKNCPTPWDYCCTPEDEVTAKTIAVAVKKDGEIVETQVPELRLLDLVVVTGRLVKDDAGVAAVEATGWWRKERPTLPDLVKFPE